MAKADLERVFGFRELKALEEKLKNQSILEAEDFQKQLDQQIEGLEQRLSIPFAEPTWGPGLADNPRKAGKRAKKTKGKGVALASAQSVSPIDWNFETSERYARFSFLYLIVVVLGTIVALGALYFDYEIMTEFWTRVLADEFMEVPESLAGSVISKSAQVIFATAAFHFLLSRLAGWGRTMFIWVFFLLTFGMISGFGIMNATISMPANPEALAPSADKGPTSIRDALGQLGLKKPIERKEPATRAESETLKSVETWIRDTRPILWLVVPGLVFLVVTGIGALCLQLVETNVQNFVKSRDIKRRRRNMRELETLRRYKTLVDRLVGA